MNINKSIRTRFAPSPTGPLHMGGVRTALYAYLFARKHNGKFLLRIEDTDQNRYVEGAEQYIIDALTWCGIDMDEGVHVGGPFAPYRQSERKGLGFYQEYAEKLIASGHAYYAFDTNEALEMKRKEAEANKTSFQYNAQTRTTLKNSLTLSTDETAKFLKQKVPYVIRLKVPEAEEISFTDMVRGHVTFHSSQVDDKVLIKADGMPTYHHAHIVDDIMMEITHAIRGEEWLPSAPAHILIYKYLGLKDSMPQYAHLPLLLKPDGNGKLSKRDGDRLGFPVFPLQWTDPVTKEISSGYRERGYYPEAFINMLAFLGWNPGTEQELFTMDELIETFSFERVHKAGAKFDPEKAKWFNQQYLRKQNNEDIAKRFIPVIRQELKCDDSDYRVQPNYVTKAVALLKDRVHFENELWNTGVYLFVAPTTFDEKVITKKWSTTAAAFFEKLMIAFDALEDFSATSTENYFKETATKNNLKPGDVLQLFRVLLSGTSNGVALFDMVALLGKAEVKERIGFALKQLINNKTLLDNAGDSTHENKNAISEIDFNTINEMMRLAIDFGKKSISEEGKLTPKVGAAIYKDGKILGAAFRGQHGSGDHAEYTLFEKVLKGKDVSDAILFTTLEPCTHRNNHKTCSEWVIEKKIKHVYIGYLDPNPKIYNKGCQKIREAGIEISYFPRPMREEIENDNAKFIEQFHTNLYLEGKVSFDFTNNDNKFTIGNNDFTFITRWSPGSNTQINAYNYKHDNEMTVKAIAIAEGMNEISEVIDGSIYNSTSSARTLFIGQILILENFNGYFAAVKILDIKDNRFDNRNELTFEYKILDDKSANFSKRK